MPLLAVAALLAPAGCGGSKSSAPSVPDDVAVQRQVAAYLAAFERGNGNLACALLTSAGQAGLRSESERVTPSGCADTVKELSSTSRRLHSPRIDVQLRGSKATATVRSRRPPYDSGVLLEKHDGKWLIAYPPGLLQKYVGPGGVKPDAVRDTPSD